MIKNLAGAFCVQTWSHVRLDCAIYWGTMSWSGYVKVPQDSPDRIFAEAYREHQKTDPELKAFRAKYGIPERWAALNTSYDILQDVEIHGGFSYGIDDEGWCGFDCGHAWDDIDDAEVEAILPPEAWDKFSKTREILSRSMGKEMWPPGRMSRGDPWYQVWTLDRVTNEVNWLAEQIAARHLLLFMKATTA